MAAKRLGKAEWTRTLGKLYSLMGQSETTTSRSELAAATDEPIRNIQVLLAVLRHLGVLEHSYSRHESGQGRASQYRLAAPYEEAERALDRFGWENITSFKDGRDVRPKVALASPRDGGPTKAIAGPDQPSPFSVLRPLKYNESAAQVEAARQYRDRVSFIEEQLDAFRQRGIKVDMSAFKIERDARLDALTLALPYIDSLEKQVENLSANLKRSGDVPALRKQLEETQVALRRCQEARKSEVSAKVLRAQEQLSRD